MAGLYEFYSYGAVDGVKSATDLFNRLYSICDSAIFPLAGPTPQQQADAAGPRHRVRVLRKLSEVESVYKFRSELGSSAAAVAVDDLRELRVVKDLVSGQVRLRRHGSPVGGLQTDRVKAHAIVDCALQAGDAQQFVTLLGFQFDYSVSLEGVQGTVRMGANLVVHVRLCRLRNGSSADSSNATNIKSEAYEPSSVDKVSLLNHLLGPSQADAPATPAPVASLPTQSFMVKLHCVGPDNHKETFSKAITLVANRLFPLLEFARIDRKTLEQARQQTKQRGV